MNPAIKLFIVDDHPFFRQGVAFYLETLADVEIIGEEETGRKALVTISEILETKTLTPENLVILMDLQMPEMNGIETTSALMALDNRLRILVLTSQGNGEAIHEAMAAGAAGFCLKDAPPQELENAIRGVHGGGAYLGKGVLPHLLNMEENSQTGKQGKDGRQAKKGSSDDSPDTISGASGRTASATKEEAAMLESLTPREREVLVLLARGLSNKAIGETLFVSEKTVKTHVANLFSKLMVTSRTQAALWAQHQGLDREEI